jgi:cyclophilin family peptidyl-prolyl cis-trans isomerase
MQALARIADPTARLALQRGLSDEDGEVVSWAAFGLGRACDKEGEQAVLQLALRAATWAVSDHETIESNRFSVEPLDSIAGAIGRCATPSAEATLRSWLRLDARLAERAALALGTIASKQHRLDSSTLVALLEIADSGAQAPRTALYPFTRLSSVENNVQKRLLVVATKNLEANTDARRFAVRALQLAGDSAVSVLERVLCNKAAFDSVARSDAVRGLSQLGDVGQQSLSRALIELVPKGTEFNDDWLTSSNLGPILEITDNLNHTDAESRPLLENLARIPISAPHTVAARRRIVELRCQAAAIFAGTSITNPFLIACDPTLGGRQGALALSRVLGRAPIRGTRVRAFLNLAASPDPVVRESALRLLRSHPEANDSSRLLAESLSAESAGVVATAANILAEHPERSQSSIRLRKIRSAQAARSADFVSSSEHVDSAPRPTPELLLALGKATHRNWPVDAIDVRAQLVDAIAALGALSEKPYLDELCHSPRVVLRKRAENALRRLGDTKCHCAAPASTPAQLPSTENSQAVHLRFHTDMGPLELWLEPDLAPMATSRLTELAQSGFFDNTPVHRVVSGFVVQLGDRAGDGYGGAGSEPLLDELSPVEFRTADVGIALSGPDTGSSQFFVLLGPHPHLDGEYTRVGRASVGWDRLVIGDLIEHVERVF